MGRPLETVVWIAIGLVLWAASALTGSLSQGLAILSAILWGGIILVGVWLVLFAGARPSFLRRKDEEE